MMQRVCLQLFIAKKKKKRDLSRFSSLNSRMFVKSAPNFFCERNLDKCEGKPLPEWHNVWGRVSLLLYKLK